MTHAIQKHEKHQQLKQKRKQSRKRRRTHSRSSRLMNFGMSFSGYWCEPNTLLPRVMMHGILNEVCVGMAVWVWVWVWMGVVCFVRQRKQK
jgi:hypothetical protein